VNKSVTVDVYDLVEGRRLCYVVGLEEGKGQKNRLWGGDNYYIGKYVVESK
jgi:hypothetical protein